MLRQRNAFSAVLKQNVAVLLCCQHAHSPNHVLHRLLMIPQYSISRLLLNTNINVQAFDSKFRRTKAECAAKAEFILLDDGWMTYLRMKRTPLEKRPKTPTAPTFLRFRSGIWQRINSYTELRSPSRIMRKFVWAGHSQDAEGSMTKARVIQSSVCYVDGGWAANRHIPDTTKCVTAFPITFVFLFEPCVNHANRLRSLACKYSTLSSFLRLRMFGQVIPAVSMTFNECYGALFHCQMINVAGTTAREFSKEKGEEKVWTHTAPLGEKKAQFWQEKKTVWRSAH